MTGPLDNVPGDPHQGVPRNPSPGQTGIVLLGISMGILLMAVQLWLLTLAFNLYLSGNRRGTLIAAIVSGFVFLGGLVMLGVLRKTRRMR